jgi:hypothetical protein
MLAVLKLTVRLEDGLTVTNATVSLNPPLGATWTV